MRRVIVMAACCLLPACMVGCVQKGYAPKLANGYDEPINVEIAVDFFQRMEVPLQPGEVSAGFDKDGFKLDYITVWSAERKLLAHYASGDMDRQREKRGIATGVWALTGDGAILVPRKYERGWRAYAEAHKEAKPKGILRDKVFEDSGDVPANW